MVPRKSAKDLPLEQRVETGDLVLESEATKAEDRSPEAAARIVAAAICIGEDPKHDPGNMQVEVERTLLASGRNQCKLFRFSSQADCDAYSELLDKEQGGHVRRVGVKELIDGTDYALFINWVSFDKPESVLREKIQQDVMAKAAALMKRASKGATPEPLPPSATDDPSKLPDDPFCRGRKANSERCRRKKKPGSMFCGHHDLSKEAPVMDRPPPTHTGLPS